ncbi:hypothetical protein TSUD_333370 [Trifolium subterraneum]|uniref:Peptidase M48 domain-containing protein n=1 Tax=Trifolium subterraneum TaxID=3900 RepID=A0A2Z6MIM3_TRISU|nr:hypothetical protein TSUD_333370 [Trifolium subterraneum]
MFHLDGLNWEISVIREPDEVITQSYAGGKIVTTTGSVRHYQDDATFATIVAHEVARVVARHYAELETRCKWVDFIHDLLNLFVPIDFK